MRDCVTGCLGDKVKWPSAMGCLLVLHSEKALKVVNDLEECGVHISQHSYWPSCHVLKLRFEDNFTHSLNLEPLCLKETKSPTYCIGPHNSVSNSAFGYSVGQESILATLFHL